MIKVSCLGTKLALAHSDYGFLVGDLAPVVHKNGIRLRFQYRGHLEIWSNFFSHGLYRIYPKKNSKEEGNAINTVFTKIKHAFTNKMAAFKKELNALKNKILKKLHLSKEEKRNLFERLKFFKRKKVDKVQPTGDSIEEVNERANITEEMFQGDMALSDEQQKQILADINGTDSRTKRQAFVYANAQTQWFKGVRYFFDDSADEKVQTVFKKAAELWMAETCINFKFISSKMLGIKMKLWTSSKKPKDRLRVLKGKGCWSYVGRLGGIQNLSLGPGCESIDKAAHEIGHTLGFFHTHSRHDRDQFITVYEGNILPKKLEQYALQSQELNNNYNITYDYGSVMHYGATSSSIGNNMLTMVPKDVQYTETLGSPFIGFYDLLMINTHYNCFGNCNGTTTKCQNNGFVNPRNCSKCVCPSGYGGDFCEKRPPGCGAELDATGEWKSLVDEVGNRTAGHIIREDFMKCNYWIKAPDDKKIEVKVVSFTDGVAVDGCTYAGVEIKTHSDQGLSGHRFCSWNTTTVLKSELNKQFKYDNGFSLTFLGFLCSSMHRGVDAAE
ncbi:Zinc metalloproteinase [Trichostrongylus colubriformis]|uniref:Zinc metalloproteinase n=1 Tax=Trichostrongylus colubriformis TaxID=6319 RepID=A0AAN8IGN4_TRICO